MKESYGLSSLSWGWERNSVGLRLFASLLVMLACVSCAFSQWTDDKIDATKISKVRVYSDTEGEIRADSPIKEIHMAREADNGESNEEVDSFKPRDRTMFCVVTLKTAKTGTQVKFSWWLVDAVDIEPESIINVDYSTKALENVVYGHMTLPRDWPVGKYKVQVYVESKLDRTLFFSVK